ncbi:MAG TPA: PspC domain-containing protein [Candidatus Limnocylindrales bacterium]
MNERLYRSRDDRMLAGVAGGLAERWDMDPSIVRVVWAVLVILTGGIALLVYIVMAVVVPEEYEAYPGNPASAPAPAPVIPGWVAPGSTPPGWIAPTPGPVPGGEGAAPFVASAMPSAAAPDAAAPVGPVAATVPMDYREARRSARSARRASRPGGPSGTAGIVFGAVLVLVGGGFFVRELLPTFDFDWFGPLVLIGLGVVLLVAGFARDTGASRGPTS